MLFRVSPRPLAGRGGLGRFSLSASRDLYLDLDSDGAYEANEKVDSVAGNEAADYVWPFNATGPFRPPYAALGLKIDIKGTSNGKPAIYELEAYYRDPDDDNLTTGWERSHGYFVNVSAKDLPGTIAYDPVNGTAWTVHLPRWNGTLTGAFLNFTVAHDRTDDLSVVLAYSKEDGSWAERLVWDPGSHELLPLMGLDPTHATGVANVTAEVLNGATVGRVDFYLEGVLQHSDVNSTEKFYWLWGTTAVAEGPYLLETVSYDAAGNAVHNATTITVDHTLPTGTLHYPVEGALLSGLNTSKVTAADNEGIVRVAFFADPAGGSGNSVHVGTVETPVDGAYVLSWDTAAVPDGDHAFRAVVYDLAGNRVERTAGVTVDNGRPEVAVLSPPPGTISGVVEVNASASDPSGVDRVEFYVGGSLVSTDTTPTAGLYYHWTWDTTTSEYPDGSYVLTVNAFDTAENANTTNADYVVDNTGPAVSFVQPLEGDHVRGVVEVQVAAVDDLDAVEQVDLYVDGGSKGTPIFSASSETETWQTPTREKSIQGSLLWIEFRLMCQAGDSGGSPSMADGWVYVDAVQVCVESCGEEPVDPRMLILEAANERIPRWQAGGTFVGPDRTLDLAGEFNQYIGNHTDAVVDGTIAITLRFEAANPSILEIVKLVVVVWPRVSSPLTNDTDGDGLRDDLELALNGTSLRWDSDNDGLSDYVEATKTPAALADDGDSSNDGNRTSVSDSDTDDDLRSDSDPAALTPPTRRTPTGTGSPTAWRTF